jgi:DNA repair protein RecO (recombination protein O)
MIIVTEALVARSVDYGEADRICTLLTREQGKLSALARSARKSRKRFGGALALFVVGEATLKTSGRRSLLALERFDSREDLGARITADVIKVAHGSYMLELARELWGEGQPDEECFELVCAGLRALAALEQPAPGLLRAYELQILGVLGLAPALDSCVSCGTDDAVIFDLDQGGLICASCVRGESSRRISLDLETCRTLAELQRIPLSSAGVHQHPSRVAKGMREVMVRVVRYTLRKDLKSLAFLLQMARR